MRVVVENASLEQGRSLTTGIIYFDSAERCFPEQGWFDNPVPILGWWLRELQRLPVQSAELVFMEGPFRVFADASGDALRLRFMSDETVEFRTTCDARELQESVLAAARKVLATCDERGWKNSDIDELRDCIRIAGV